MTMVNKTDLPNRQSIRLEGHDYSGDGAYHITVCTQHRENLFGEIENGQMVPNDSGRIVENTWAFISGKYDYIRSDAFVLMPNHIHGIWKYGDHICADGSRSAGKKRKSLGRLVGAFKTVSTKKINELRGKPGAKIWQRDFFDRVIRNEEELNKICRYIADNPKNWATDENNIGR